MNFQNQPINKIFNDDPNIDQNFFPTHDINAPDPYEISQFHQEEQVTLEKNWYSQNILLNPEGKEKSYSDYIVDEIIYNHYQNQDSSYSKRKCIDQGFETKRQRTDELRDTLDNPIQELENDWGSDFVEKYNFETNTQEPIHFNTNSLSNVNNSPNSKNDQLPTEQTMIYSNLQENSEIIDISTNHQISDQPTSSSNNHDPIFNNPIGLRLIWHPYDIIHKGITTFIFQVDGDTSNLNLEFVCRCIELRSFELKNININFGENGIIEYSTTIFRNNPDIKHVHLCFVLKYIDPNSIGDDYKLSQVTTKQINFHNGSTTLPFPRIEKHEITNNNQIMVEKEICYEVTVKTRNIFKKAKSVDGYQLNFIFVNESNEIVFVANQKDITCDRHSATLLLPKRLYTGFVKMFVRFTSKDGKNNSIQTPKLNTLWQDVKDDNYYILPKK